jgi:cytochrome c553
MVSRAIVLFLLLPCASTALGEPPREDGEAFFESRIRPVLAGSCFKCHGPKRANNGLRVDSREALLKGGQHGPAILPGRPDKSLLIRALGRLDAEIKMPPDKPLPQSVRADFATWVNHGAVWPATASAGFQSQKHWAFEPVQRQRLPADPSGWSTTPIDRFVLAGLREHGLEPVPMADKRTLIRRLSYDLIGLPPTPDELAAFLADQAPEAWAKLVDRLLASPHYGERWGRHWLDVARYADTAGDNADYPIPEARLYRDYVIDSFNSDKPYDQFVQEQLAGDILARNGPQDRFAERVVATGFLALSRRYATAPYELWHLTLEDTIDTTGRAFLGMTLRCARCHDHKFDPVTQQDYYALYGIFASTQFPWAGGEEFASMKKPRQHFVSLGAGTAPDGAAAYAVQEGKPVDACIQLRGEVDQPGATVRRGVPEFLAGDRPPVMPASGSGRLQLARWLTAPDNPLVARVLVNRVWQHHFGKGIVGTSSNFGLRGDAPTHPELLDWLAADFVDHGWSIKNLHRRIVLSTTYRLSSRHDDANTTRDPANRSYWRFDRQRLDAESIRDALLLVSGNLDRRRPRRHPFPGIEQWKWTQHQPFKDIYPSNHRSVYLMTQRFQRHPFLALFDGADTNSSTERRTTSTVPQQALFLLNNPFARDQAAGLARRLLAESGAPAWRIDLAHRWAWSRPANPIEVERGLRFLEDYARALASSGMPVPAAEFESWLGYARILTSANEFVYVD